MGKREKGRGYEIPEINEKHYRRKQSVGNIKLQKDRPWTLGEGGRNIRGCPRKEQIEAPKGRRNQPCNMGWESRDIRGCMPNVHAWSWGGNGRGGGFDIPQREENPTKARV
jgi:hypothetical protein